MDANRFDALTRQLAARRVSRRAALSGAAGLLAALGLRQAAATQVTQAQCGNVTCKNNPGRCNDGCVCCVYTNALGNVTNTRCRPPGACGPGQAVCPEREVLDPVRGCVATTTTTTTTTTVAPTTTTSTTTPAPTTPAPTTTTTTTPAPTTTTTTTTTTSTTTTTLGPAGTCAPGANACSPPAALICNGNSDCRCAQTTSGQTRCRRDANCLVRCTVDADCVNNTSGQTGTGPGTFCIVGGACCDSGGNACAAPC